MHQNRAAHIFCFASVLFLIWLRSVNAGRHNFTSETRLLTFYGQTYCELDDVWYMKSMDSFIFKLQDGLNHNTQGITSRNASLSWAIKLSFIEAIYNIPLSQIIEVLLWSPTERRVLCSFSKSSLSSVVSAPKTVCLCEYKSCAVLTFMGCKLIYLNSLWKQ